MIKSRFVDSVVLLVFALLIKVCKQSQWRLTHEFSVVITSVVAMSHIWMERLICAF